jgi:acetate kinase
LSRTLLVINAGSSSIKFSVFSVGPRDAHPVARYRGQVDGLGARSRLVAVDTNGARVADQAMDAGATHDDALGVILNWIEARSTGETVVATGHRVVHGGVRYARPVRITPGVLQELEALVSLAPLHQPHNTTWRLSSR